MCLVAPRAGEPHELTSLGVKTRTPYWTDFDGAGAGVARTVDTDYGIRYEIVAPLAGPNGRMATFRSIWQMDTGTDYPRLITMVPE